MRNVTSKEDTNHYLLGELIERFDVVTVPIWNQNRRNRMYDKSCIIDLEYVMHCSYNWSKNAQNNDETFTTALDKDFVNKFVDEFISLYNEYKD